MAKAKKLRTPLVMPRTQGGTFYTFGSAMEDVGLNINELGNKVALSHYVLLDLPEFGPGSPFALKPAGDYSSKANAGDWVFAEGLQDYALNAETLMRNRPDYNFASNATVSERAFWKWLKERGALKFEKDSQDQSYYTAAGVAKGFGHITAGSQRSDDYGVYNETYVQIPSSYGQMKVLFKPYDDNNWYKTATDDEWFESASGGTLIEYADSSVAHTGISCKADYDVEPTQSKAGGYLVREDADEMQAVFDLADLRAYYGNEDLTYDEIGMEYSLADSFAFNAVLVYYSIYDSTGTSALATNAYGLLVLDSAKADGTGYKFPEAAKTRSTAKSDGTSYAFRINIKTTSAYAGDVTIEDNATEGYSSAEDFNEVIRDLSTAVEVLRENAQVIATISSNSVIIKGQYMSVLEKMAELKKQVDGEGSRDANEEARQAAEKARASAETARASAESARSDAEAARASAENARSAAETARAKEFATLSADSRSATTGANAAAESATAAAASVDTAIEGANAATANANGAATVAENSASAATASATAADTAANGATAAAQAANTAAAAATASSQAADAAETARSAEFTTLKAESVKATADASTAAASVEAFKAQVDASIANKANVDGEYPNMVVGLSDGIRSKDGIEDSSAWIKRTTGGTTSVTTGSAQLRALKGQTIKQLIGNPNFASFTSGVPTGWSKASGVTIRDSTSQIAITCPAAWDNFYKSTNIIAGHTYYLSTRIMGTVNCYISLGKHAYFTLPCDTSYLTPNKWKVVSAISKCTTTASDTAIVISTYNVAGTLYIDKSYGVRLIDLTELGLDTKLTTTALCDEYFGDKCLPFEIEGFTPSSLDTPRFQLFDKSSMVLSGKSINATTGAIEDNTAYDVLRIPVRPSTANNNGYRVHLSTSSAVVIGWNPFSNDNGAFDNVYDIVSATGQNVDYSSNGEGYLYIQVPTAQTSSAIVHLKWSYGDVQFASIYTDTERCTYKLNSLPLNDCGTLNGIRSSDGTLYADEADFIKKKKTTNIGKYIVTGDETISGGTYGNSKRYNFALPATIKNGFCLCNSYIYDTSVISSQTFTANKLICLHYSSSNAYFIDSDYSDAASFKTYLKSLYDSGTPIIIYYILANSTTEDLPSSLRNTYNVDDLSFETMVASSAVSAGLITTFYLNNLVDKLRNLPEPSNTAEVTPDNGDNSALRALYVARGAIYNSTTHYYELNGLTDITEAQMAVIFAHTANVELGSISAFSGNVNIRTNFDLLGNSAWGGAQSLLALCADNTNIQVLNLYNNKTNIFYCNDIRTFLYHAANVKKITGILNIYAIESSTLVRESFGLAYNLTSINLDKLKISISIPDSPNLDKASILYMVANAANGTTDITITLHATAYAMANADADIQSAITTNGHITLVSA